jgi:hypothetical protein
MVVDVVVRAGPCRPVPGYHGSFADLLLIPPYATPPNHQRVRPDNVDASEVKQGAELDLPCGSHFHGEPRAIPERKTAGGACLVASPLSLSDASNP